MNTDKNIFFLGGDARQITAAKRLTKCGYNVSAFLGDGTEIEGLKLHSSVESALQKADRFPPCYLLQMSAAGN